MNKTFPFVLLAWAALTACADDNGLMSMGPVRWVLGEAGHNPTLEDISPDRVIVLGNHAAAPAVEAEAARGCAAYNRTAHLNNQTCVDNLCWQKRYVFTCRVT